MDSVSQDTLKSLQGAGNQSFMQFSRMTWIGPFSVDDLLNHCLDQDAPRPPVSHSVYLISSGKWATRPSPDCDPLYVGSTTGRTPRFRTRVGDVIIDAFGFFQTDTGHSSGGISLYHYCRDRQINPKQLTIGWLESCGCTRCAEYFYWRDLEPRLNKKAPPRCLEHSTPLSTHP